MPTPRPLTQAQWRPRAFTLIELLVVVAIIAALIAILLPMLSHARDSAKRVRCMANLHSIGTALFLYADENNRQLPGYDTIGKHAFRIQPGGKLAMRIPGGFSTSPFPEAWGIQAVLDTGTSPRILPNGVAVAAPRTQPYYFPADSEAWICPANPGPSDRDDWTEWNIGYAYRCNSGDGKPRTLRKIYNLDYLSLESAQAKNPLIWDNFNLYPGDPGFNGPFDRYTIDRAFQRTPHRVPGMEKATQLWIAFYVDGHCQMNGLND